MVKFGDILKVRVYFWSSGRGVKHESYLRKMLKKPRVVWNEIPENKG